MGSRRKANKNKYKQNRKWLFYVAVLFLVVLVASAAYVLYPRTSTTPEDETPEGLRILALKYMTIMHNLNSSQTKTEIAAILPIKYNQTELFNWEHNKLTFANDETGWYEEPCQILDSGKGICVQWSIVYVSASLAQNHESRLVVAVDTSNWKFIHVWAEDSYNGRWVHVDPSDSVWDNPNRYQTWNWGTEIGSTVRIYAFEDNTYYDVTSSYS